MNTNTFARKLLDLADENKRLRAELQHLEWVIAGSDVILRDTSALATHWRGRAAELEARLARAEAMAQYEPIKEGEQ